MTARPHPTLVLAAAVTVLAMGVPSVAAARHTNRSISVGFISTQSSRRSATIGASINTTSHQDATRSGSGSTSRSSATGGDSSVLGPSYLMLSSSSALLQSAQPFGPGTFWYPDGSGQECVYAPDASPLCYTVTQGAAPTVVSPVEVAASLAAQLHLQAGAITVRPAQGVTGAASWFWLDPSPTDQELTETLDGETVTVDASPSVSWQLGDGATTDGAGVPYQPGTPPAGAVTHTYQTRCLPGDQGTDPYVLASCGPDGYQVTATVEWTISYSAHGPITQTGTLPARTTETSVSYPVTEIRGFLTGDAAG